MGKHSKKSTTKVIATNVGVAAGVTGTALAVSAAGGGALADAASGPNWPAVIACESGGNPRAQNAHSSASGLFQFLDSSWRAYGGGKYASRAMYATVAQQYEIANVAFAQSGLTPWNASRSCWANKAYVPSPKIVVKPPAHSAPAVKPHPRPPVKTPIKPLADTVAPPAPAAHTPGPGRYHVVKSGESLWRIASAETGNPLNWHSIYNANHAIIGGNADLILPGQSLAMP